MKHHHPFLDRTSTDEVIEARALVASRRSGCNCGPVIEVVRCEECAGVTGVRMAHHDRCKLPFVANARMN